MAIFPRPQSPAAVYRDLRDFIRQQERHKIVFAFLALCMPAIIVWGFYLDANIKPAPKPIIYVQNYTSDRTDEEIIAQQKIDAAIKHEQQRKKQEEYKRLAEKLGIE